jgi:hypothetical protein
MCLDEMKPEHRELFLRQEKLENRAMNGEDVFDELEEVRDRIRDEYMTSEYSGGTSGQ